MGLIDTHCEADCTCKRENFCDCDTTYWIKLNGAGPLKVHYNFIVPKSLHDSLSIGDSMTVKQWNGFFNIPWSAELERCWEDRFDQKI